MRDITELTVCELAEKLKKRELSAEEAAAAYLRRIEAADESVGAYLSVTKERALGEAKKADVLLRQSEARPLTGIPYGLKDNICTNGVRTTCASQMLQHYIPPYDAAAAARLKQAGAVLLGKCNMDEFGMGSTTEHSYFKRTRNPHDPNRVPGGSSGGPAAAVAAGEAAFALGSDTGGSIRQPAAFCGAVGMKPTYGAVSRYGLVAFASSLDQIGPITRDVRDSALVLGAIIGGDPKDATSLDHSWGDLARDLEKEAKGLKAAVLQESFGENVQAAVKEAVLSAAKLFQQLGAEVEEISLSALAYALPAYYVLSSAEASSNLARFDGVKYGYRAPNCETLTELYRKSRTEGFGNEVKRRVLLGGFALSAGYYEDYYKKAQQARNRVRAEFLKAFERYDVILLPTAPTTAYRLGEKAGDPLAMYAGDRFTVPASLAGLPALSLPCGKDRNGLPIGLQLIGPPMGEAALYRAAYALEQALKGGGNE